MNQILKGMVGSKAYGLDHAGSDEDWYAVHVADTLELVGFGKPPAETIKTENPDFVSQEVGKFVRLAAGGNPTVNEILWLPNYVELAEYGHKLIDIRTAFLSQKVRSTYLGYANQQFKKLEEGGRFTNVPTNRTEKNARHLLRLVEQGTKLWLTGEIQVRPDNPRGLHEAAEFIANDVNGPAYAREQIRTAEDVFARATPLPQEPDVATIQRFLLDVRIHHIREGQTA